MFKSIFTACYKIQAGCRLNCISATEYRFIPTFPYQSTSGLEEQWAQGHVMTVLPWQTLRAAVTAASWKHSHMWQLVKTCGNLWSLHFHHLYDAKLAMVTHLIWENSKSNIKYIWKLKSCRVCVSLKAKFTTGRLACSSPTHGWWWWTWLTISGGCALKLPHQGMGERAQKYVCQDCSIILKRLETVIAAKGASTKYWGKAWILAHVLIFASYI